MTIMTDLSDGKVRLTRTVRLSYILEHLLPERGLWADQFSRMESSRSYQLLRLARYAQKYGLPNSEDHITIGADKRVIDGHVRIYVASLLGIEELEVHQWIAGSSLDGSGSSEV